MTMSISSEDLNSFCPSITFHYSTPSSTIHRLPDHQVEQLQSLFPDRRLRQSDLVPSSGLPYLESLTDLAVELAFDRMKSTFPIPSLVYIAGDCPQISQRYPNHVWNIEVSGNDFADSSIVSSCTHHLRDNCECAGTAPDTYLFSHSIYYYSYVEVARALYFSKDRYAFSVHHPFRGAVGFLGFGEVRYEVSHGRVSTTRFPSFERSDLNWIYTKNSIELYQSQPGSDEQLHLYEISPQRVTWTLSWDIVFDSDDIQIIRLELVEGRHAPIPPLLEPPTIESLLEAKLAYGQLNVDTGLHVEQIWDQLALYRDGGGRKVFSIKQLQQLLRFESNVKKALDTLWFGEGNITSSSL